MSRVQLIVDGTIVYDHTCPTGPVVPPVIPPVVPPGGGGGGTQPPGTGTMVWPNLGGPDEQSPTGNRLHLPANTLLALRFNKTTQNVKVRLQGVPWVTGVVNSMPGISGEVESAWNGDLSTDAAPIGPVVVEFKLIPVPGQVSGDVSPQVLFN